MLQIHPSGVPLWRCWPPWISISPRTPTEMISSSKQHSPRNYPGMSRSFLISVSGFSFSLLNDFRHPEYFPCQLSPRPHVDKEMLDLVLTKWRKQSDSASWSVSDTRREFWCSYNLCSVSFCGEGYCNSTSIHFGLEVGCFICCNDINCRLSKRDC